MRANSPRTPGCAEDASNCQPPTPLQQAALVFISTACKNSAWPSSALVTGRAARWDRSLVETPPPGCCHRRRGADSQYGWPTSPLWGVVNQVLRIHRQHLPTAPPSLTRQRGSPRDRTRGAQTFMASVGRVSSRFIRASLDALAELRKGSAQVGLIVWVQSKRGFWTQRLDALGRGW